jgi:homoserine dehydrogenase
MNRPASWGLIGFGNIGHEVVRQLGQADVAQRVGVEAKPRFIVTTKGVLESDGQTSSDHKSFFDVPLPDVTFIAIPSSDDGKAGFEYISHILKQGKMVVTAEKGALANNYAKLKELSADFSRLGTTATAGGGTHLLRVASEYCQDLGNITQIHLALNGTLAAMLDWVTPLQGEPMALDEAARRAIEAGYAEPGSDSASAIIKAEAEGDIPKKVAIFCNTVGLSSKLVDWNTLRFSLREEQIEQALNPQVPRRFIVSLYPIDKQTGEFPEDDIIGGFNVDHDGWRLVSGFRRVDASPLFSALTTLTGPGNGMVIGLGPETSDGVYAMTGPGAGVHPTANAMIDDYIRLKAQQEA